MTKKITDESEAKMVARIFQVHRETVYKLLGISYQAVCRFEVGAPIITNRNSKPGDIDVLIGESGDPQKAIAIECKRIKITAASHKRDIVNKLSGIEAGRVQAEALCNMGFCKTYLALMLQADVVGRSGDASLFKFPLPGTLSDVRNAVRNCHLCPHVGVLYIENTQPAEESFENLGGLSVETIREAVPHAQNDELTGLIAMALK